MSAQFCVIVWSGGARLVVPLPSAASSARFLWRSTPNLEPNFEPPTSLPNPIDPDPTPTLLGKPDTTPENA